jgi:HAMP domain-containing protein
MRSKIGRFDRSFVIRMIRDFLIALTIIIVLELGGRFVLASYHFQHQEKEATELAAERLASDVRDIMLNQGGPVAARTVYPIIRRNHEELGLEITIVPSELTIEAIRQSFGREPEGLQPEWSEGRHHEAKVELQAEPFCTTCHFTAQPGDVLGHVTVRNYQAAHLADWWAEARVVSVVGMANVILHTIVLFLLLRLRMEPLLRLRSMVARLAKGRLDLSQRAEVKSDDEFGELALDFNHFLDRVCHLVEDLDGVLNRVVAVNDRLARVSEQMGRQIETVQDRTQAALKQAVEIQHGASGPSAEAIESLDLVLTALSEHGRDGPLSPALRRRLQEALQRFRESAGNTKEALSRLEDLSQMLTDLARGVQDDSHYLGEILLLEERMRVVSETGQVLLDRLRETGAWEVPDTEAAK